jgi:PTH1 family peptidyl-tRNA hydrolase
MKSIIQMLGTDQFLRVRIGTGHQPEAYAQVDWVLGHFSLSERVTMAEAFEKASSAARALLTQPPEKVMSAFNAAGETAI